MTIVDFGELDSLFKIANHISDYKWFDNKLPDRSRQITEKTTKIGRRCLLSHSSEGEEKKATWITTGVVLDSTASLVTSSSLLGIGSLAEGSIAGVLEEVDHSQPQSISAAPITTDISVLFESRDRPWVDYSSISGIASTHDETVQVFEEHNVLGNPISFVQDVPSYLGRDLPVFSSENFPTQQNWGHWMFESQYMDYIADSEMKPLMPHNNTSFTFRTRGDTHQSMRIGGINGIGNSLYDAVVNAEYLKSFTKGFAVEWVYNCTHNILVDAAEAVLLNMLGYSPNNEKLLQENWLAFHEENKNNPHAKYLQNCHSQGVIHVKNALEGIPKEVRERVIVIAIAPATIVPSDLCYKSYNYASKSDLVPNAGIYLNMSKNIVIDHLTEIHVGTNKDSQEIKNLHNELILFDPHPDAQGIDHNYQSRTYFKVLLHHIEDYLNRRGIYND